MFLIWIYLELSYVQIAYCHCTHCLLHTLDMLGNATMTLVPIVECLAFQHILFFSTLLMLLFFSIVLLPLHVFVYVHNFVFPFPLLLSIISQLCFPHSCFCELQNLKNTQLWQQTKTTFDGYSIYFCPWASYPSHSFFNMLRVFQLMLHLWNYDDPSLSLFVSLV